MGDVSSMVARAEVYQSDVPRIRPGDPADVEILGTRVSGKVTRIGSIVGKNQLTSIDPRAPRDLRVVEVTIALDRAEPASRFVDMEVEAMIRPSGTAAGRRGAFARGRDRPGGRRWPPPVAAGGVSRVPPIALRNVMHGGRRTLAAVAGVAFAVTMVLLQLGFYGAVKITATNLYEQLDFDVVLLSATYDQFFAPGEFPMERLRQARSVDSVDRAMPLYSTFNLWRCPPYPLDDPAMALGRRAARAGPAAGDGCWATGCPGRSSAASCW